MRGTLLACALALLGACRTKSQVAQEERRAIDKSVSEAKDRVHELKLLEISSGTLTPEQTAERSKLEMQAAEDENGGTTPEALRPPPAAAPEAPPAEQAPVGQQ